MNKRKTLDGNDDTESTSDDRILNDRKAGKSIANTNSKFAKKRKLSDDGKIFEILSKSNVSNNAIKEENKDMIVHKASSCQIFQTNFPVCSKNTDSKSTQALLLSVQELLEEELKCSICKEMFINPVTLNCSHSFCEFCISQWKKEQNTCPICRQDVTSQNVSLVLDKCVSRVLDYSSEKVRKRRKKVLSDREKCTRLLNSSCSSDCERSNTSEESGNFDIFEILEYIFDNSSEQNIEQTYDDYDQCIIN